ncbi:MAG: hypothetical protein RDU14_17915 [Melioribacteraceae bacterium]|nr:hypothetical protein [Melioribacteraceae bacterium]
MKKLIYFLFVLILSSMFIEGLQVKQSNPPYKTTFVVVKVKYQNVKDLTAFQDSIKILAARCHLIIENEDKDINYKSVK